jgi:hypothetical protein
MKYVAIFTVCLLPRKSQHRNISSGSESVMLCCGYNTRAIITLQILGITHVLPHMYVEMPHSLINIHNISVDVSLHVFNYLHTFTVFIFDNVFVAVVGKELDLFEI